MAFAVAADGMRRQLRAQQARTSYLDDLARFAVPVLIVSGGLDEVCPPERQAELLAHCPQARLVTMRRRRPHGAVGTARGPRGAPADVAHAPDRAAKRAVGHHPYIRTDLHPSDAAEYT